MINGIKIVVNDLLGHGDGRPKTPMLGIHKSGDDKPPSGVPRSPRIIMVVSFITATLIFLGKSLITA